MKNFLAAILFLLSAEAVNALDLTPGDMNIGPCGLHATPIPNVTWGGDSGLIGGTDNFETVIRGQVSSWANRSFTQTSQCEWDNALQKWVSNSITINTYNREAGHLGIMGAYRWQGFGTGATTWADSITYGQMHMTLTKNGPANYEGFITVLCPHEGAKVDCGGFSPAGIVLGNHARRFSVNQWGDVKDIGPTKTRIVRPAKAKFACVDPATNAVFAKDCSCDEVCR